MRVMLWKSTQSRWESLHSWPKACVRKRVACYLAFGFNKNMLYVTLFTPNLMSTAEPSVKSELKINSNHKFSPTIKHEILVYGKYQIYFSYYQPFNHRTYANTYGISTLYFLRSIQIECDFNNILYFIKKE